MLHVVGGYRVANEAGKKSSLTPIRLSMGLKAVSRAFLIAAEEGHDRLTANQLLFFCTVAEADLKGSPLTLTEAKEVLGPAMNKSVHTSYKTFLVPRGDSSAHGIGWLDTEPDPRDMRRNYIRLTARGREIAKALAASAH